MRTVATLCAALLVAVPGLAQAAQPCLTTVEASSLAAYALPSAISGATKRCSATLAPSSFLRTQGSQLAARYAGRKAQTWPSAKAAFLKLGAGKDDGAALLAGLPDPSMQQLIDVMIEGLVSQKVPVAQCGDIDRIIGLLAPLPPQNMADLIAEVIGLAGKPGGEVAICKS